MVFQNFTQIYQLPESYMAKEGVISVIVDIPMVLIRDSLPFMLDGKTSESESRKQLGCSFLQ